MDLLGFLAGAASLRAITTTFRDSTSLSTVRPLHSPKAWASAFGKLTYYCWFLSREMGWILAGNPSGRLLSCACAQLPGAPNTRNTHCHGAVSTSSSSARDAGPAAGALLPSNAPFHPAPREGVHSSDGPLGGADAILELLQHYLPLSNALQPARLPKSAPTGRRPGEPLGATEPENSCAEDRATPCSMRCSVSARAIPAPRPSIANALLPAQPPCLTYA